MATVAPLGLALCRGAGRAVHQNSRHQDPHQHRIRCQKTDGVEKIDSTIKKKKLQILKGDCVLNGNLGVLP